MARSRLIKPGFATNEFLATRSFEARLLFALLPTIADREGRLEDRPRKIKAALFPFEQVDVDALLCELAAVDDQDQDHPFLIRYEVDGRKIIQIVKFAENQNPHKDERASELAPCEHDATTMRQQCSHGATTVQVPCSHSAEHATSTQHEVKVTGTSTRTGNRQQATSNKAELPSEISTDGLLVAVDDWLAYKAERRESLKPKGREQFISRVSNLARERGSPHVEEKLRRAMSQGWKGWDFENGNQNGKLRKDTGSRSQIAPRGSLAV